MAVEQPSVNWAIKQQPGGLLRERMLVIAHSTAVDLAKVVLPFHGAKKRHCSWQKRCSSLQRTYGLRKYL